MDKLPESDPTQSLSDVAVGSAVVLGVFFVLFFVSKIVLG